MDNQTIIPDNPPVPVRPIYTAVPVPAREDEDEEIALVKWVKSNFFALLGLIASLVTLYASSQVRPLTQELNNLKEDMLEVKTAQAQVLGISDTKYANKETTDIQYQNLQLSIEKLNTSVQGINDYLLKTKK